MKLVQVDPKEAVHIYASEGGLMPMELAERILDRFIESGVKCCRVEDDKYTTHQILQPLMTKIRTNKKYRDSVTVRQNLSKVYLIRK